MKDLKKDIQEVNWSRKNKQTQVGEKLKNLETQWVGLVSKNYEIEQAIVQLEAAFPAGTLPKEDEENESSEGETIVQNFLDRIATLELGQRQKDWYKHQNPFPHPG